MAYKTIAENRAYKQRVRQRKRADLSVTYIRENFRYDPETGTFWRRCGAARKGYAYVCVNAVLYSAHRLAWFYMTGAWPKDTIDHRNRNSLDNQFCNLREATVSENCKNRVIRRDNKSGFTGVSFHRKLNKWVAYIDSKKDGVKQKRLFLGTHKTKEAAYAARCARLESMHGEFANFGTHPPPPPPVDTPS